MLIDFLRATPRRTLFIIAGCAAGILILATMLVGSLVPGSQTAQPVTIIGKWRPAEAGEAGGGWLPKANANPVEYTPNSIIYGGSEHPVEYGPDMRSATNDGISCALKDSDTLDCTGLGGLINSEYVRADVMAPSVEVPR